MPPEWLLQRLSREAIVADVGCGYGRILQDLANRGFVNLHGCDMSTDAIAEAAVQVPSAQVVRGYSNCLPWPTSFADLVLCMAVLSYSTSEDEATRVAAEIGRVVRPGGFLYLTDFVQSTTPQWLWRYAREIRSRGWGVFETPGGPVKHRRAGVILGHFANGWRKLEMQVTPFRTWSGQSHPGVVLILQKEGDPLDT